MSERFTIERCRENFNRAVRRALHIKFEGINNNDEAFPVEMGRYAACYRERFNRAIW